MSKYHLLWKYIAENCTDAVTLSFAEIQDIAGIPIDHSFLRDKKELIAYGYQVGKISMKEQTVSFHKAD